MMGRLIFRKLLLVLPTALLVSLVVFLLVHLVPGDPAVLIVGDANNSELLARVRAELGLGRPLIEQYVDWLGRVVRFDLGRSLLTQEEVLPLVLSRFSVTAWLVTIATALSTLLAVPLGMIAAWRHRSRFDTGVVLLSVLALSIPSFWMAIMLILLFGVELGWLPTMGYLPPSAGLRSLAFILLPVVALTFVQAGTVLRMARSATLDVMRMDYVAFARSKGLSDRRILFRHVLPNAFSPVLTIVGLIFGNLLAGAAIIETVFTIPGLGRLLVDSITSRDYPVIQGAVLFISLVYIAVNLAVDLLYPVFDPKLRAKA